MRYRISLKTLYGHEADPKPFYVEATDRFDALEKAAPAIEEFRASGQTLMGTDVVEAPRRGEFRCPICNAFLKRGSEKCAKCRAEFDLPAQQT